MLQRVAPLALTQGVDLLFGGLQHFGRRTYLRMDDLTNIHTGLGQSPEHGHIPDDAGIALHIGGGGGDLHQLQDVIPGIIPMEAQLLHFVQHRHRVDGLGEVEHGVDGFIDFPVLLQIKILRPQNTDHIRHAAAVNKNRTQYRLLRLQRIGGLSVQQFLVHVFFSSLYSLLRHCEEQSDVAIP